jgi:hypothetical protein
MSDLKTKALELAVQTGGTPDEVVKRAASYHGFLNGEATATAATTKPNKPAATGGQKETTKDTTAQTQTAKGAATAGGKPNGAGAATAAGKPNGASAGAAATGKPAGAAAGNANASPIPADTKAPGGTHTYADVVATLTKVRDKATKEECFKILAEDGGGAKTVRDLKPALYDAVVEACNNVLADEGGDGAMDPDCAA